MVDLFLAAAAHSARCSAAPAAAAAAAACEISIFMLCGYMRQLAAAVNCIWVTA